MDGVTPQVNRMVYEVTDRLSQRDDIATKTGIDEPKWVDEVLKEMEGYYADYLADKENPKAHFGWAHKMVMKVAVHQWYRRSVRRSIHKSREGTISVLRELEDIKKTVKASKTIHTIKLPNGTTVLRYEKDCTQLEIMLLSVQYRDRGERLMAKANWYQNLAMQMSLLGFAGSDTVADFLEAI
jgi:hypothetical protein